jgi:hypothetical protein
MDCFAGARNDGGILHRPTTQASKITPRIIARRHLDDMTGLDRD